MLTDFFKNFAAEFSRRHLDRAAERFCYPSAIYQGDMTMVYHSKSELGAALDAYRARLSDLDYSRTTAEIVQMTPKRGDKQIIWVDWRHFDAAGQEIERSSARYFCSDINGDDFKIRLVEYVEPTCAFWPGNDAPAVTEPRMLVH